MTQRFTAIIEREDDTYVALCPELDIASQGESVNEVRDNLREAIELFRETASPGEIRHQLNDDIYITQMAVGVGSPKSPVRRRGPQDCRMQ